MIEKCIVEYIESNMKNYNPDVGLLRTMRTDGYSYCSSLRNCEAHMTRESIYFAAALLHRGTAEDINKAEQIISNVLELQDDDPNSKYYGIWPWYKEETLDQMVNADYNWAEFCGKGLLVIELLYGKSLQSELREKIKKAVVMAVSAIKKRDIKPSYTNISLMGTLVVFLAGELTKDAQICSYAQKRIDETYDYNMYHGMLNEYNSPTYTVVALEDLSFMVKFAQNEQNKKKLERILFMGWESVANHFHAGLNQWTGPHSRCYKDIIDNETLSFIQFATGVKLLPDSEFKVGYLLAISGVKCPEYLLHKITNQNKCVSVKQPIYITEPQIHATFFTTPQYSIGSFNRSDMWNQRRALNAYFGTKKTPGFVRLRCMHDQYDFSSGLVAISQIDNMTAGLMCFADNYGDKHFSLDMIYDGVIEAEYIAMRFESNMALGNSILNGSGAVLQIGDAKIAVAFYGEAEIARSKNNIDFIYQKGKCNNIKEMQVTYGGFAMIAENSSVSDAELEQRLRGCNLETDGKYATISLSNRNRVARASVPTFPQDYKKMFSECKSNVSCSVESGNQTWVVRS